MDDVTVGKTLFFIKWTSIQAWAVGSGPEPGVGVLAHHPLVPVALSKSPCISGTYGSLAPTVKVWPTDTSGSRSGPDAPGL